MTYFDFSEDVRKGWAEATDFRSRLTVQTKVHCAKFPAAAERAGFHSLSKGSSFVPGGHGLVLGAAPWSNRDLAVLEDLVSHARAGVWRVSVFSVDDINFPEMVNVLPELRMFRRAPVVVQYLQGELTYFGDGHDAILWLRQL